MRRALTTLLLALAALTPMADAQASRPGVTPDSKCVSGYEFNNLPNGTPRADAEAFLDGPGRGWGQSVRIYRSCAGSWASAQVSVRYVDGKVRSVMGVRMDGGRLLLPPQ